MAKSYAYLLVAVILSVSVLTADKPISAALITRTINQSITAIPDGPNQIFDLDVDQDGSVDLTFRSIIGLPDDPTFASFADIVPPFGTINGVVIDSSTGDGFPTVSRLQPGAVISAASLFSGSIDNGNLLSQFSPDPPTGNFQGQTGYVGFEFAIAGATHFGFAHITVNDLQAVTDPLAIFISTVSYESIAGQAVTVVPEPSTLLLAAVGAAVGYFALCGRKNYTSPT